MKRVLPVFLVIVLFGMIFSPGVKGNEGEEEKVLVSLGDSISAGYNLEAPTNQAFPHLIGEGSFEVTNLAVPGWTTRDLLMALKDDETFWTHIEDANVVTINIGSNDLLQAINFFGLLEEPSSFNPEVVQEGLLDARYVLWRNLTEILGIIRYHTDEPIIFYNIYNPIVSDGSFLMELLYIIVDELILDINRNILESYHSIEEKILVVDAYGVFSGNQEQYIIPGDIHPNTAGQERLAQLADAALGYGEVVAEVSGEGTVEEDLPVLKEDKAIEETADEDYLVAEEQEGEELDETGTTSFFSLFSIFIGTAICIWLILIGKQYLKKRGKSSDLET
ncbi:lysophospholipase L1-like esterase [Evansella vedderi]|uniref:Lysophospholipase L1-like esterase n=1 Tax=Evansella vedderi TaxID=38282 RepID=A0ABT9ZQE1_9BACI|nr:SGNH/GDSL hydrolase family protein [Evansella vedderi]MDQ0253457.1 lysophospholipase L1-like esterase [Evansella vedderi]